MKTNKPLMLMEDDRPDVRIWNATINNSKSLVDEDKVASFTGAWLIVECYMYRKIYEAFALRSVKHYFKHRARLASDQQLNFLLKSGHMILVKYQIFSMLITIHFCCVKNLVIHHTQ